MWIPRLRAVTVSLCVSGRAVKCTISGRARRLGWSGMWLLTVVTNRLNVYLRDVVCDFPPGLHWNVMYKATLTHISPSQIDMLMVLHHLSYSKRRRQNGNACFKVGFIMFLITYCYMVLILVDSVYKEKSLNRIFQSNKCQK